MNDFIEKNKSPLSIIIGALIIGIFIYLSRQPQDKSSVMVKIESPTPTTQIEIQPSPTASFPSAEPTTTNLSPTPRADDETLIKKAIAEKLGVNEENLIVTVSQNTGKFAKGGIREKDAMGGAMFIAAYSSGKWVIVHDGQSNPLCSTIAPYNFPTDMVPECLDASGNVVVRK